MYTIYLPLLQTFYMDEDYFEGRTNTHVWYHCINFPYVLASIMGLLIFMKSEKINILDYFL